ncbi:MAG: glycosyltransferase family 4 protein [Phycisphaerae bacterium]|nr:glycosyltransferase family 4 protein [Phycisphaerae bacterium]
MVLNDSTKMCFVSTVPNTLYFYAELLKALRQRGVLMTVVSSESPLLFEMQKQFDCEVYPVNITRTIRPLKDIQSYRTLCRLLKNRKYDLVHAHTPKGGLLGMAASRWANVPVRLYTIHGLPLETARGFKRTLLKKADQVACSCATHVLAVSPSLRDRVLEERLCKAEKLSVLGDGSACGVNLARYTRTADIIAKAASVRKQLQIPQDALVLGFVGRVTPEKGIPFLVKNSLRLFEKYENLHLLIVGGIDNSREVLEEDVLHAMKTHPRIHMAGHIRFPVEYYAAMDILVLPTKREGFGMCNIEASAMGLPVVASRIPGCVDSVQEGRTGFLYALNNDDEFTAALEDLIEHPEKRKEMGEAGAQWVRQCFSSERLVEEHIRFYEKVLNSKRRV